MKKLTLVLLTIVSPLFNSGQVNFNWATRVGSSGPDYGNSIAVDASGNAYTTGFYSGTVDFDPGAGVYNLTSSGSTDIFVSKQDANGNFVWAKSFGGSSNIDFANAITLDGSGNIYITGGFSGTADFDPTGGVFNLVSNGYTDVFVCKLNSSGNLVWAKSFGSSGSLNPDQGNSIAVDGSGNVYTTGQFWSTVDFDPGAGTLNLTSNGDSDIFEQKLDASGNFVWANTFGGIYVDIARGITLDASNNVYVTGVFVSTVDFDPSIANVFTLTAGGGVDAFVHKVNSSGTFVWAKNFSGANGSSASSAFALTNDGNNLYVTGTFLGTVDFDPNGGVTNITTTGTREVFIVKLSASGNLVWAKNYSGGGNGYGYSIALDGNKDVYLTGFVDGTIDFDPGPGTYSLTSSGSFWDIYVSKLSTDGDFGWAFVIGSDIYAVQELGLDIALDPGGNVYSSGNFSSVMDFDPGPGAYSLTPAGNFDAYVLKLCQSPVISSTITGSSTLCVGSSGTYSVNVYLGAGNYTWTLPAGWSGSSNTNTINITAGNTSGTIGVTAANDCGSTTQTLYVSVSSLTVTSSGNYTVCSGESVTLTASGANTYSWVPGPLFGSSVVVTPSVNTTYSVYGLNNFGCVSQATAMVTLLSTNPTFTPSLSNPFVCVPNNSTNLVISPPGTYTLLGSIPPIIVFTNSVTLNPNSTTIYTISGVNLNGCIGKTTIKATVVPCACINAPGVELSGSVPSIITTSNTALKVVSDLTVTGGFSYAYFIQNDVVIYPGVKLVFSEVSGTVNIVGSHLHGCGEMWQGIVVPYNKTKINIVPGPDKTSLIEDANIAVDMQNLTPLTGGGPGDPDPSPTPDYLLYVDSATFNKNITSIRIGTYQNTITTYPFHIVNSLFTSRNITYSVNSWPTTNTVKNSSSGSSSPMETPFISNTTYSPQGIVSLLYNYVGFAETGIELNYVGFTNQTPPYTFKGIEIGSTVSNEFNCFDNLRNGIVANTSNLRIINAVFQNGRKFGQFGGGSGGIGIRASSTFGFPIFNRNSIVLSSVAGNTALSCRFYEMVSAADVTDYFNIDVSNANVYSVGNNFMAFNTPNGFGNRGFNVKTNRFQYIKFQSNRLYNIKNNILVNLSNTPENLGFSYREIGKIEVANNFVDMYLGTLAGIPYVNIGLSIADPLTAANYTVANGPVSVLVTSNTFSRVNNAISVANMGYAPVGISSNTVHLLNESPIYSLSPTQYGINALQCYKGMFISSNSINGPYVWGDSLRGIRTSHNGSLSVRCNTTVNTAVGIEFNGLEVTDYFEDNLMTLNNNTYPGYGIVLDHNAKIASLNTFVGSASRPTDNRWTGTWTSPNFKALTTGPPGTSAQQNRMYIQYGNTMLNPNGSCTVGVNQIMSQDEYFYTTPGNPLNSLRNATITQSPGCRTGVPGGGNQQAIQVMEDVVAGISTYTSYETPFMERNYLFKYLKCYPDYMGSSGSPTLAAFYASEFSGVLQLMDSIEVSLANNDDAAVSSLMSSFSPSNAIESNYKSFYSIYMAAKDSSFNTSDSTNLIALCNKCPYDDGGVVWQARALYNAIYNDYFRFSNSCASGSGARPAGENTMKGEEKEEVHVLLKSMLYPNPNNGTYVLRVRDGKAGDKVEITIFDITGKKLTSETKVIENAEIMLNSNLDNGSYIVKVKWNDGTHDIHHLIISK